MFERSTASHAVSRSRFFSCRGSCLIRILTVYASGVIQLLQPQQLQPLEVLQQNAAAEEVVGEVQQPATQLPDSDAVLERPKQYPSTRIPADAFGTHRLLPHAKAPTWILAHTYRVSSSITEDIQLLQSYACSPSSPSELPFSAVQILSRLSRTKSLVVQLCADCISESQHLDPCVR